VSGSGLSEADYGRFGDLVRARSGLEFPASRRADLERAVDEGVRDAGVPDAAAFFSLLTGPGGPAAFERWTPALSINETHFFRNRPQMEALERRILPDLIERRRVDRTLRIWSAACSSGEEPYSLAMIVHGLLPDLERWDVRILATDIDRKVLTKARRGVYGAWSFREVPAHVQSTYFTRHGSQFEVAPHIRSMVEFGQHNLVDTPPSVVRGGATDLVVCRNVLIYFAPDTIRAVVARLHDSLAAEGWLVVGHAEPSLEIFRQFDVHNFPGTVVYQRRPRSEPGALPLPWLPTRLAPAPVPQRPAPTQPPARRRAPVPAARPARPAAARVRVAAPAPAPVDRCAEAVRLLAAGRTDQAITLLERAAGEDPKDARAPFLLAKAHASRLALDEAERWVDVALSRTSLMAPAHYLRGLVLQEKGDVDGALEAHRRCTFADPDFMLGHFALADLFGRTGQPRRAGKALDNVARLLDGRRDEEAVPEGDGLTVGRLRDLVSVQRELAA
jgi:chemotaxis protein methyltransferase CheR